MIKNYYEFVDEFIKLQGEHSGGDWLAITLNRKKRVLKRFNISSKEYLWNVPLEVLNEILKECIKGVNNERINKKAKD